ncbi:Sugar efflux transporter A [Thalassocella blandensis]|nr:Sugar efflux transporter A [Thalassocella blandensis]
MSAMVFIYGACVSISWPFIALFGVNELGISSSATAVLISAVAISGLAFSHIIGIYSDKIHDRRKALWVILACSIIGCLVLAFVRNYIIILLCCCTFLGVGAASFAQLFALAREQFEHDGLGEIDIRNNTLRGIFSLSWVFGPAIGAFVISTLGYAEVFVIAALGYVVLSVFVLFAKPVHGESSAEPKKLDNIRYDTKIYFNLVAFSIVSLALNIGTICLPLLVNKTHQLSEKILGLLMGATAFLEIPLMVGTAILAKKIEKFWLVLFGFLFFSVYGVLLYGAQNLTGLFVAQAVCAVGVAIIMGLGMSYCQELLPGRAGEGTTLFTNASLAGSVASGMVFAIAVTFISYQQIYLISAFLCLLSSGFFVLGRKKETLVDLAT